MRRLLLLLLPALLLAACGDSAPTPSPTASQFAAAPTATPTLPLPPSPTPSHDQFYSVDFISPDVGWVAANRTILKTSDGGQTWNRQYNGSAHVVGFDALDAQHAWAVGENTLLGTTDGGQTWQTLAEPSQALLKVTFTSANIGYGVASSSGDIPGFVVKTADGGRMWQTLSTSNPAGDVCFRSATEGWAGVITPQGPTDNIPGLAVLHTTDGGQTWTAVLNVSPASLSSGDGVPFQGSPVTAQLRCTEHAVWFLAIGLPAHLSVRPYRVYRMDSSGQWSPWLAFPPSTDAAPGINPTAFAAPNDSAAYVGGTCGFCTAPAQGAVTKTTDGGQQWTQLAAPDKVGVSMTFRLSFVSSNEGWLVTNPRQDGDPGLIFHTTDGGRTWVEQR